jgi:hypothetical protein
MPAKTGQQQDTRFRPGQSGNPRGRPQGSRHKTTLAIDALLDGDAEKLTRKAIEMAMAGRVIWPCPQQDRRDDFALLTAGSSVGGFPAGRDEDQDKPELSKKVHRSLL